MATVEIRGETLAPDGTSKIVHEVRLFCGAGGIVDRRLTRQPDGSWQMTPMDQALFEQDVVAAKRAGRGAPSPEQVRELRERLGLSQRRMSELVGGGVRSVNKYETGQVVPSSVMSKLLTLLHHDPSLIEIIDSRPW